MVGLSFFGISKPILLFNFPEVAWVCSVAEVKHLKTNQIGVMVSKWAKQLAIDLQDFAFLLSRTSFSILLLLYQRFSFKMSSLAIFQSYGSALTERELWCRIELF